MSRIEGVGARGASRGYTLIEVTIAIAIAALLSALAVSAYANEARKSRRQDALNALASISNAQQQFYMNRAVNPAARTYTTNVAELGLALPVVGGATRSSDGHYTVTVAACAGLAITECFVATATAVAGGAQAGDTACQVISVDSRGRKTPAVGGCW
ncbi:MAG: type IV pilin protein [Gammaproteobacteria bacterium]